MFGRLSSALSSQKSPNAADKVTEQPTLQPMLSAKGPKAGSRPGGHPVKPLGIGLHGLAEIIRRTDQRDGFLSRADEVRALLQNGEDANINVKVAWHDYETTPLFESAVNNEPELVRVLLQYGARTDTRVGPGYTAAYNAALEGHTEVLQLLVDHDPSVVANLTDGGFSPLYIAAQGGHRDCVAILLNSPSMTPELANLAPVKLGGASALYIACQAGHDECVEELLNYGVEVDVTMLDGSTSLMVALYMARRDAPAQETTTHLRIAEMLLARGASLSLRE